MLQVDFRDLMSLTSGDKTSSRLHANSLHRYMGGLLEVEPLHFTCHATSDGTRMERMDAGKGGWDTYDLVFFFIQGFFGTL